MKNIKEQMEKALEQLFGFIKILAKIKNDQYDVFLDYAVYVQDYVDAQLKVVPTEALKPIKEDFANELAHLIDALKNQIENLEFLNILLDYINNALECLGIDYEDIKENQNLI